MSAPELVEAAGEILCFLGEYAVTSRKRIGAGETVACGYWLLRFEARDGALEASELQADGSGFQPGISLAARYWREQHAVCARYEAAFEPPLGDRMVVVSAGVLEGDPVQGVRYPSPGHMSGWWISTDRYDGDVKSLRTVHLYHLTAARPELARYLALPDGFRFSTEGAAEDVWFDPEALRE